VNLEMHRSSKMVLNIKVSGLLELRFVREKDSKHGLMDLCTKDIGLIIKPMDKVA
jgi:hypothetical protein